MRGKQVFSVQCSVSGNAATATPATEQGIRSTLTFRNRQRDRRLNLPFLRRVLRQVLTEQIPATTHDLCFHFVTAEEMARVNWQFLKHEGSTDVITFDYGERSAASGQRSAGLSGEAFIGVADAVKQASEFKTSWQSEVVRYAVHALLHLRGYDDLQPAKRRVMKREENRLMRELAAVFDLDQLETQNSKP
ncbi:MAG: rRNA maturation RNase YbeY [Pedosphaera sp.]|nr:MAG: rRNA maturation RNase YbeY [Pedosphaera sp.]